MVTSAVCYHPLFLFNQFGDLERCSLCPGNVHSADGWRNVLEPVVMRYKERKVRLYFRGDAAFASPGYTNISKPRDSYVIRLKAIAILQRNIAICFATCRSPARPFAVSTPASAIRPDRGTRSAVSWPKWSGTPASWFLASVLIVTNLSRPTKRVVAFYNHRGTAEQHIKEGKNAINWTRLSCRKFRNNAVRLQLHAWPTIGQLHEDTGFAEGGGALVDDDVARQAGEDRGQGCPTWPLRYVPIGSRWLCRGTIRKILELD